LGVIVFVVAGGILHFASPVLVPLVLAGFLAMLLLPAVQRLGRFLPRWLALLAVLVAIGLLVAAGSSLILVNVQGLAEKAPFYAERFEQLFADVAKLLDGLGVDVQALRTGQGMSKALQFLVSSLQSAASAVGQIALVLVLLIFMLLEAPQVRRKLAAAFSAHRRDELLATFSAISGRVQRYMVTKTLVSVIIAVLTGVALLAAGVDFPFLWAFLTFLLNFIPNVGPIIAVAPPVLLALIQFPSPTRALVLLPVLIAIQVGLGNFVEPRLMGRSVNLSPLVVLLAIVFWGWLWGVIGVVLAVPLTVTLQIIFDHVEGLRPVAVLLGDARSEPPAKVQEKAARR
jgi:predicted PurR-regulated permease PerM